MSPTAGEEQAARAALRARQGAGARYDAAAAPAADLLLARRGTAYFARKLGELTDDELEAPSRRPGASRRGVIAEVGYHARAMARLMAGARTAMIVPMYRSDVARRAEIAQGATLPARALRSLVHHAAIHLDVEWRDLKDADWEAEVMLADGTRIAARATPALRAAMVWQAALDLGNGGRVADVPVEVRKALTLHRSA